MRGKGEEYFAVRGGEDLTYRRHGMIWLLGAGSEVLPCGAIILLKQNHSVYWAVRV
jgi:hypothetical protein